MGTDEKGSNSHRKSRPPYPKNSLGDRFYSLGDRKNCRPNRKAPLGDKKRARGGALSYVAQQRYNKNGRNANRPRTAGARQEAKFCISMRIVPVVGSGQWVRPRSSAMSIDVALSTRRDVGRDTYSLPQEKRGCAASGTSMDMPPLHKSCAPGPCQWTWPY